MRLLFVLLLECCIALTTSAQNNTIYAGKEADSAAAQVIQSYLQYRGERAPLYTGLEYIPLQYKLDGGIQYYRYAAWMPGKIVYEHEEYQAELMYDLIEQKIIIKNPYNFSSIQLFSERITSFTIDGHEFLQLADLPGLPEKGFYEVLQRGHATVIAHWKKRIQENLNGRVVHQLLENNSYYVVKDNVVFEVSNKRNLEKVLDDDQVRQYINKIRPDFKLAWEESLVLVTKFYNTLH